MDDGINAGDATDRLEVRWSVDEPHPSPRLSLRDLPDAWVLLDHELVRHPASTPRVAAVAVPPDIETLRADDPAAAARWRLAVREALQESLTAGYVITGMTLDGFYTLELS